MVSSKLAMITAAVFAGTGLSLQGYLECSSVSTLETPALEHRIETSQGPSLLPLVESPLRSSSERVSKARPEQPARKVKLSNHSEPSRKAPVVSECRARKVELETKPVQPEPAQATIGLFESYP